MEARRPLCAPADSSVGTERLRGRSRLLAGSDTLACLGASACASVRSPCTCPSALGPALPNKSWPLMCAVEPSIRARSTEGQNCSQCLQSLQMRAHALSVAEAFWGGLLDHKEGLEPFNLQLSPSSFFWSFPLPLPSLPSFFFFFPLVKEMLLFYFSAIIIIIVPPKVTRTGALVYVAHLRFRTASL